MRLAASFALMMLMTCAGWADSPLERLTTRSNSLGWEAVGRLDIGGGGFCSGVLVATDLVLTAAHCLFDQRSGARKDPRKMVFRAGLRDGEAIAEVRGRRAVVLAGYDPRGPRDLTQLLNDVALVQLAEDIPAATAAPFVVGRPVGPGDQVSVVSYARGREQALSWQRACQVRRRGQGVLEFSCDVDFGSSGAPVFETSGGRGRLVSIMSRAQRGDGRIRAYGMEIAAPLRRLKSALRAGQGVFPHEEILSRRITVGNGTRRNTGGGAKFVRP